VLPAQNDKRDHLAFFVVTGGKACAEWLHRRIREDWGFPDPPEMTMAQRFTSRYRGKRYSLCYPACPDLEDQAGLGKLLKPEDLRVASASALVFHHPDCTYFSVGEAVEA
jgi:5-methyltetrahydrofolate--homocysteine methyltransferase